MAFNPNKYIEDNIEKKKPPKKVKDDEAFDAKKYVSKIQGAQEEDDDSFLDSVLSGVATAGEYIDRYTGAPVRSGIGALLDEDDKTGFFGEYAKQFGKPTETAPTGKDIAKEIGVPDIGIPIAGKGMPLTEETPRVSTQDIVGLGIDFFAEPFTVAAPFAKGASMAIKQVPFLRQGLKTAASKKAFKALSEIPTSAKMREFVNRSIPEIAGKALVEENLTRFLNKPEKLLEKIAGSKSSALETKVIGGKKYDVPVKAYKGGLIDDISSETDKIIDSINTKAGKIDIEDIQSELLSKDILRRIDPEVAEKLSEKDLKKYGRIVKEYLKPSSGKERTLKELQSIKRDIGKKLSSKEFFMPQDKSLAFEKVVLKDIYHTLQRKIEDVTSGIMLVSDGKGVPAGDLIKINNQKVSALMDIKGLLENVPADSIRDPSAMQRLLDAFGTGLFGLGVYAATQSKLAGLSASGVYGTSKLGKAFAKKFPGIEADILYRILHGDVIPSGKMGDVFMGTESIRGASFPLRDEERNPDRSPQSIPETIMRTPLPRNSQELLEKADFVRAKAAQQAPEMYDYVNDILSHNPENIKDLMPALVQAVPHLFEQDKYDRVDGIIYNPQKKEYARNDIMKNDDLSHSEKMLMINQINKTGEYPL